MKEILLLVLILSPFSCSSLKRTDGSAPQPTPAKKGLSMNGGWAGKIEVKKGFWCDVRGGILTFGSSGPTEEKATEIAKQKCHNVYSDSPCELISCKANR